MKTLYLTLLISAWSLFGYTAPAAIVVKFNYALLDFSFIDDEIKQTARLIEIFNKRNKELVAQFFSENPGAKDLTVEKIFPGLTTKDTLSISRLGHKVTIPPFWACFRIYGSTAELAKWVRIFTNYPKLTDYAHFDFQVEPLNAPNDELYNLQIGLNDPDGVADINIEEAWSFTTGRKFI